MTLLSITSINFCFPDGYIPEGPLQLRRTVNNDQMRNAPLVRPSKLSNPSPYSWKAPLQVQDIKKLLLFRNMFVLTALIVQTLSVVNSRKNYVSSLTSNLVLWRNVHPSRSFILFPVISAPTTN